jgi:hypothetical protein
MGFFSFFCFFEFCDLEFFKNNNNNNLAKIFSKNRKISPQIYTTKTTNFPNISQIFKKNLRNIQILRILLKKEQKYFGKKIQSSRRPKSGATFFPFLFPTS